jgi:hypothetical protein
MLMNSSASRLRRSEGLRRAGAALPPAEPLVLPLASVISGRESQSSIKLGFQFNGEREENGGLGRGALISANF